MSARLGAVAAETGRPLLRLIVLASIGLGIPAVVAGFAVAKGGGLVATSSEYGAGVIVLAALAAVNLIRLQDQKQRK